MTKSGKPDLVALRRGDAAHPQHTKAIRGGIDALRLPIRRGRPRAMPATTPNQLFGNMLYSRSTVTGATPDMPSTLAAAGVTSMIRPPTNGPRSLIVTTTERPLL